MRYLIILFAFISVGLYAQPETVDVGTGENTGDGDPLRDAMIKLNTNDGAIFDTAANHLDTLQAIRPDVNTNADDITIQDATDTDLRDTTILIWSKVIAIENFLFGIQGPPTALEIHYKFTNDSLDESANRRDFTPGSAFNYDDAGSDNAQTWGHFNGANQYVETPTLPTFAAWTVIMDNKNGTTNEPVRTAWGTSSVEGRYNPSVGRYSLVSGTDSIYTGGESAVVDTIWSYGVDHVAWTSDGDIYLGGLIQSTSGSIGSIPSITGTLRIGQSTAGSRFLYGRGDNFKIYSGVLTAVEIFDEYSLNEYASDTSDTTPPVTSEAAVSDQGILIWGLSEALQATNDSLVDALTYTADAVAVTIDSIQQDPQNTHSFTVYTASVEVGQALLLSYDASYFSGVKDVAGNLLASFTNRVVTNNLLSVSAADIHYRLENNGDDDANGFDAILTNMQFTTNNAPPEGIYSLLVPEGEGQFNWPSTYASDSIQDTLTFFVRARSDASDATRETMSNEEAKGFNDGINLRLDFTQNDLEFTGRVSGSSSEVRADLSGTIDMNDGLWHSYMVTYMKANGETRLYADGLKLALVSNDSIVNNFATIDYSGPYRIGRQTDGELDDIQIYSIGVTEAQADSIHQKPGVTLSTSGTTPPDPTPGPNESTLTVWADSAFAKRWSEESIGEYTIQEMTQDFPGARDIHWNSDPDGSNDIQIDTLGPGYNGTITETTYIFKSWVYEGQPSGRNFQGHMFNFPLGNPSDFEDVFLEFNMMLDPDWNDISCTSNCYEFKTPGFVTEYNRSSTIGNAAQNSGRGFQTANLMKAANSTTPERRFDPYVWYYDNPNKNNPPRDYGYSGYDYYYPNSSTKFHFVPGTMYNIKIRMKKGTPYGDNGLYEVWINNVFVSQTPFLIDETFIITENLMVLYMKFYQHLTTQDNPFPTDRWIGFGDLYVYKLKTNAAHYFPGATPIGTVSQNLLWDTDAGTVINR